MLAGDTVRRRDASEKADLLGSFRSLEDDTTPKKAYERREGWLSSLKFAGSELIGVPRGGGEGQVHV